MWKLHVTMEGGLVHTTKDVRGNNPGWQEFEPNRITRVEFPFLAVENGKLAKMKVLLENMEAYNFFVEASRSILTKKDRILGFWFLGKMPNSDRVTGFFLGPGKCSVIQSVWGQEFRGTPTGGWKFGFVTGRPVAHLLKGD